jgi:LysM domain
VIQAGDYCDKISQEQNVSTFVFALYGRFYSVLNFFFLCYYSYQLAVVNPDMINKGCTNLTPGESICLGLDGGEDCSTTQVVQPGDTCSGITGSNGLNMTIFLHNNPQLDDACDIYVGQVRVFFPVS